MPINKELLEQVMALSGEDFDELNSALYDRLKESQERLDEALYRRLDAAFYNLLPYEGDE